jgi:sodium-independent sulfate anion transporter 11
MASAGRSVAKVLGINVDYRKEADPLENSGALSVSSVDTYVEREPTASEYLSKFTPSFSAFKRYLRSLFPFLDWIFHYNLTWLFGDVVAGRIRSNPVSTIVLIRSRRDCWLRCYPSGHGICPTGSTPR